MSVKLTKSPMSSDAQPPEVGQGDLDFDLGSRFSACKFQQLWLATPLFTDRHTDAHKRHTNIFCSWAKTGHQLKICFCWLVSRQTDMAKSFIILSKKIQFWLKNVAMQKILLRVGSWKVLIICSWCCMHLAVDQAPSRWPQIKQVRLKATFRPEACTMNIWCNILLLRCPDI